MPASIPPAAAAASAAAASAAAASQRQLRIWQTKQYPLEWWWTITAFIGALTIINIISLLLVWNRIRALRRQPQRATDISGDAEKNILSNPFPPKARPHRVAAFIKGIYNKVFYRWTVPLRSLHHLNVAELFITLAYIGSILGWEFVGVQDIKNPTWWANRAGVFAINQVPLIIALAGKNNIISFLTGLSYEKLNVIHRLAGRTALLFAWIHMSGRVHLSLSSPHPLLEDPEIRWGVVALTSFSLAMLLSLRPVRILAYEVFLISHLVFIFLFLVAVMLHEPRFRVRVWPGFIFWALDRTLRGIRLVWLNVVSSPSSSRISPTVSSSPSSSSVEKAEVFESQKDPRAARVPSAVSSTEVILERLSSDTLRLSVPRKSNLISRWRAGQHFYVMVPGVSSIPWEAHPFTTASIPASSSDARLEFVIRGRDGFTKKLLEHAVVREVETTAKINRDKESKGPVVLIDGPYGHPPYLPSFDTAILIAGGSGVSYTLAMLLDILHQTEIDRVQTSRVVFIWTVRERSHVNWIASSLAAALQSVAHASRKTPLEVVIRIFVSQGEAIVPSLESPTSQTDREDPSGTSTPKDISLDAHDGHLSPSKSGPTYEELLSPYVAGRQDGRGAGTVALSYEAGRPNLRSILEEEFEGAQGRRVSVDVSGPSSLANHVREALTASKAGSPTAALKGGPSVTLHTETFGW